MEESVQIIIFMVQQVKIPWMQNRCSDFKSYFLCFQGENPFEIQDHSQDQQGDDEDEEKIDEPVEEEDEEEEEAEDVEEAEAAEDVGEAETGEEVGAVGAAWEEEGGGEVEGGEEAKEEPIDFTVEQLEEN